MKLERMAYDLKKPETWTPHLRRFAWEAIQNQRLHKARAARLVESGIAVMLEDGRCVVKIAAMDALFATMRSNTEVTGRR